MPGKSRVGIDEDAHPDDAVPKGWQKVPGRIDRAKALGFLPEIDADGVDTEGDEPLGIGPKGDAADLQGRGGGGEEGVEAGAQDPIMMIGRGNVEGRFSAFRI